MVINIINGIKYEFKIGDIVERITECGWSSNIKKGEKYIITNILVADNETIALMDLNRNTVCDLECSITNFKIIKHTTLKSLLGGK